jgi:hypothetical protein
MFGAEAGEVRWLRASAFCLAKSQASYTAVQK